MDGWVDEWMDGWMDRQICIYYFIQQVCTEYYVSDTVLATWDTLETKTDQDPEPIKLNFWWMETEINNKHKENE